jgi:hypothetical protein
MAGLVEVRQGTRYTIAPAPRQEIRDRLLELNHTRYSAEVKAGLHTKKASRKRAPADSPDTDALF